MAGQADGLYPRIRTLLPEMSKFCVVGGVGTVLDLGGAAVLHGRFHVEPLAAKAVSVTVSTIFTYFGSRFWTFRHRGKQPVRREAALFFALNVVGLMIAEAVLALTTYVLGLRSTLDYNLASIIGSGLGTVFRFYAYHKWVFLAPAGASAAAETGAGAAVSALPGGYPRWELDHAYLAAEAEAVAKGTAYSSPWQASGRRRKAS